MGIELGHHPGHISGRDSLQRAGADFFGHGRDLGEPLRQRREIEPRAAYDDGARAACPHVVQQRRHLAQPHAGGIIRLEGLVAVEVMARARLLLGRGPGGQHAPAGIDLKCIGIDDLAPSGFGNRKRQRGFARAGGPGDQHRQERRRLEPGQDLGEGIIHGRAAIRC